MRHTWHFRRHAQVPRRSRTHRLQVEVLEDRTLLSVYTVDRLTDFGQGNGLAGDLRYCILNALPGDTISFGVIGTITLTRALAEKLKDLKTPLRIAWSGCPAGCANHPLASIGFEGTKVRLNGKVVEAVDVYVGGRSGKEPKAGQRIMEAVPCDELSEVLEYLARYYPKER